MNPLEPVQALIAFGDSRDKGEIGLDEILAMAAKTFGYMSTDAQDLRAEWIEASAWPASETGGPGYIVHAMARRR